MLSSHRFFRFQEAISPAPRQQDHSFAVPLRPSNQKPPADATTTTVAVSSRRRVRRRPRPAWSLATRNRPPMPRRPLSPSAAVAVCDVDLARLGKNIGGRGRVR
ncbi:hypothetical protein QE152_g29328 [Popillia japonica]|uniref:Uncharacterized protein n=1 Tax=Popillia japonica TaxID=7064 RepID=A0AAW1JHM5_POPJA